MVQVGIKEIRDNLADALNKVAYAGERVVLARRGKGVAALVSMEDLELLEKLEDEADVRDAKRALAEMKRKGEKPIPLAVIKRRLGMK
ncbi:MAG TPA: type II toxin-antitoxin system prevent-host-death family antitoxin [Planctomycetaceae bacterium]|nr:type II toxin-antitoxin system prevent-host-death family antitoxin [Planctomycetaceae bacterium]